MLKAGPLGSECPLRWSPDQLPTSISAPHMVLLQSLRSFPSPFPQTPWILTPTPEFWEKAGSSSVWAMKCLPLLANEITFISFSPGPVLHCHLICSNLPNSLTTGASSGHVSDAPPGDDYDSPSKQLQGKTLWKTDKPKRVG